MEVLVLDGKSYVKASKAAKELGYATDYVGQLCRGGHVDAHLIGRTWYVNQSDLSTHKVEKKRTSKAKAREYAKRTIEEHRKKNSESTNAYTNIAIRYEHDDQSLLPETKKLKIESTPVQRELREVEKSDDLSFENKGATVSMSGTLTVVDVTDGVIDEDTVVLHPSDIKVSEEVIPEPTVPKSTYKKVLAHTEIAPVIKRKTFATRLEESNIIVPAEVAVSTEEVIAIPVEEVLKEKKEPISIPRCIIIVFFVLCFSLATLPITKHILYTPLGTNMVATEVSYEFSFQDTVSLISSKI